MSRKPSVRQALVEPLGWMEFLQKSSKSAGPVTLIVFYSILTSIVEEEDMPKDLRYATIVLDFKNKGHKADCGNYWGISLLSTTRKILACGILNCLVNSISEEYLLEAQCGFHSGHSTLNIVFGVCQVQEKCTEQILCMYTVFMDLTKAFHCVDS